MAGKILPYEGIWTREEVAADKNNLYLFGENEEDILGTYVPSTTQAVIRALPNSVGVITKHDRKLSTSSFFSDSEVGSYAVYIDDLRLALEIYLGRGHNIFVPMKDGQILLGTGKAKMPEKAPKCYRLLCEMIEKLFDKYGEKHE